MILKEIRGLLFVCRRKMYTRWESECLFLFDINSVIKILCAFKL